MSRTVLLIQLLNIIILWGVAFAAFCRVRKFSDGATRRWTMAAYCILGAVAVIAPTVPLWPPELPRSLVLTLLGGAYLLVMVVNSRGWRKGAPDYTRSGPMPLDTQPMERT